MEIGQPCKNGHPYDRNPSGNCRECARIHLARHLERKHAGIAWQRGGPTCQKGHPWEENRTRANSCRTCSSERTRAWKTAHRKPRVRPEFRKCGHSWDDGYGKSNDCGLCARVREAARRDAVRGGPPARPDPERFPCGHSRLTESRPGLNTCAPCHKEAQKQRYRADPETHRAKAIAWQKANRDKANAHQRVFRERNPGYNAARIYAPDAETREWLDIIRADPCSYCGGPSNSVDHIKAVSRGGENHWSNFAPSCRACNSSKRDRELLPWLLAFRSIDGAA